MSGALAEALVNHYGIDPVPLYEAAGLDPAGIGKAGRRAQLIHTGFAGPDHPQLPGLAESGYLKALFFRL